MNPADPPGRARRRGRRGDRTVTALPPQDQRCAGDRRTRRIDDEAGDRAAAPDPQLEIRSRARRVEDVARRRYVPRRLHLDVPAAGRHALDLEGTVAVRLRAAHGQIARRRHQRDGGMHGAAAVGLHATADVGGGRERDLGQAGAGRDQSRRLAGAVRRELVATLRQAREGHQAGRVAPRSGARRAAAVPQRDLDAGGGAPAAHHARAHLDPARHQDASRRRVAPPAHLRRVDARPVDEERVLAARRDAERAVDSGRDGSRPVERDARAGDRRTAVVEDPAGDRTVGRGSHRRRCGTDRRRRGRRRRTSGGRTHVLGGLTAARQIDAAGDDRERSAAERGPSAPTAQPPEPHLTGKMQTGCQRAQPRFRAVPPRCPHDRTRGS